MNSSFESVAFKHPKMYIKLLAVLGFVAVASAADLTVGVESGRIIYEQNVTASPAIWKQIHNLTVTANETDEIISRVVVIDNRPEKDGEAKVVEGGEGQKNVTIELKSPAVFRGYDFTIKVFAEQGNVYSNTQASKNPISTGLDTQNAHIPFSKDINVNQGQETKNDDDIILQNPKVTAGSTTEATKENNDTQEQITPELVGQDQTRLNRDTENQKTDEQVSKPVDVTESVDPTKNIKANENTNKPQVKLDDDFDKTITPILSDNSTQKHEDSEVNVQILPKRPQFEEEDQHDLTHSDDDQQRTVRGFEKDSAVPALNKEQKDENRTTSTTIPNVSSTTAKNIYTQEKYGPQVIPVSGDSSSTQKPELATEASTTKLPENTLTQVSHHLKGHHVEHKHAVPLPYAL